MRFPCSSLGFGSTGVAIGLVLCLVPLAAAQHLAPGTNCLGPWPALNFDKLDACRPEPISTQEKQSLLASLPDRGEVKNLTEDQKHKVSALNALLGLHTRNDVYVVKVIDVPQAWTGLYGRGVLLISAPLLKLVSSGELQALVAHEIGHEYSWADWNSAQAAGQEGRMHEIELTCDAIAVITLQHLGEDPKLLISALQRVARFNSDHFGDAIDQTSHPSLQQRREVVKQLGEGHRTECRNCRIPAIKICSWHLAGGINQWQCQRNRTHGI
jgi:Peptidase family M48